MRKDLVRLRLEMHRQQLHYHSQPLRHPLEQLTHLFDSGRNALNVGKTPLLIGGGVLLALFGHRLGKLGLLARVGLTLYPMIQAQRKSRQLALEQARQGRPDADG
jgi:hypothetical protein